MQKDFTEAELNSVMEQAWQAFFVYRKFSLKQRAQFMRAIAVAIENCGEKLIETAMRESNLPRERLESEKGRTIFQLNSYADYCESEQWMDIRIDKADHEKTPPKPDIRKMMVPLGPVLVFGAANFPFAYSTAGGDTACALAAGCPVIVKAHPAHAETSTMVAAAILKAAEKCQMPPGIFSHVFGASSKVGEILVKHPYTKAVGFTGSFAGGKQLFDWGNQRKVPIPVFAEMSSVNPVFLLPDKMKEAAADIAKMFAASITLSVGQFCTNPGVIIGMEGDDLNLFIRSLQNEITKVPPAAMLNSGIYKNYIEQKAKALAVENVAVINDVTVDPGENDSVNPTIVCTSASTFIKNPLLQREVFGPYSIIVSCVDKQEMELVAQHLDGQLTCTLMATNDDIKDSELLVNTVQNICGRIILNAVPTGVEVCLSMQHGGPFPSTTDSRFTAVGGDGIRRFARPLAFQNWPEELLPEALKKV